MSTNMGSELCCICHTVLSISNVPLRTESSVKHSSLARNLPFLVFNRDDVTLGIALLLLKLINPWFYSSVRKR
jgi:hypothetical protein